MAAGETGSARHDFLPGVDACRGVAAMLVLLYHSSARLTDEKYFHFGANALSRFLDFGSMGVDLFFVLSGFIIFYAHRNDLGRPERLTNYALRRFFRIYPVHWVILSIMVLALLFVPTLGEGYVRNGWIILKSFLLLPDAQQPINNAAWTLRHEMLFYTMFAALIVFGRRGSIVFAIWLAGIILNGIWPQTFPLSFLFAPINIEFFVGIATALYVVNRTLIRPYWAVAFGALLFLITGVMHDYTGWVTVWLQTALLSSASALIIVGMALGPSLMIPKWLKFTARISYPLYLVQPLIIPVLCKVIVRIGLQSVLPGGAIVLLLGAGTYLAAVGLHYFVERPASRLSQQAIRLQAAASA